MADAPQHDPNIVWHATHVDRAAREARLGQRGRILWLTGLSGSGKSTLSVALDKALHDRGYATYQLDGDNVRHGLCADLGFSDEDRVENLRRIREVAKLMLDAGLIVLASFISPFRSDRDALRESVPPGDFVEIYVSTPIEECEKRDPKGLYARARAGEIPRFTGISSPYEAPESPDIELDTTGMELDAAVAYVLERLDLPARG